MSQLHVESFVMPAAEIGPDSPLTPLVALKSYDPTGEKPPGSFRMGPLPHPIQNFYGRQRRDRRFVAVILENEHLRATVLPEIGGRLWSLMDKASGRELLAVNPVFQPANLAVRGAWFSGGVEWNIGIKGHSPHTVSPLFAARVDGLDGSPSLRLYEWCRIRQTPFQLDFMLPPASRVLLVRVRIANPLCEPVQMYWWSNIAVPEGPDLRVIAPAHSSYYNDYSSGKLADAPVPYQNGQDRSYPGRATRAADLFFKLPPGERPWIAALDGEGFGLVHCSTSLLKGRKLFHWGDTVGGRNWQAFLSDGTCRYAEIQAGLAPTQDEYVEMPPGRWEWLEAYGALQAAPLVTHGSDWSAAIDEVKGRLDALVSADRLDEMLSASAAAADAPVAEFISHGSGWGALERRRREIAGEPPMAGPELCFPDSTLGQLQQPWLQLLERNTLSATPPQQPPVSWMVQPQWQPILLAAIETGSSDHWLAWLHLGVFRWAAGDSDGAAQAWRTSLQRCQSPWAWRNLAVYETIWRRHDQAAQMYQKALAMRSDLLPLAIETINSLLAAQRPCEALELIDTLDPTLRDNGRIRLLGAAAALDAGDSGTARRMVFDEQQLPVDLREGEVSLSELWYRLHECARAAEEGCDIDDELRLRVRQQFPPPQRLDFRLNPDKHSCLLQDSPEQTCESS